MNIPFSRPAIGEEEIAEVVDCLRSGWITTGPRTAQFEKDFAALAGVPHALAVSSATAGLHLAMMGLELQPGDEVITTPMTWPATVNTIVLCGARPVLVDIDPDTLNLDAGLLAAKLTRHTRAIVPVHFAGQPCDMDAIGAIAAARGLRVIEDAAHAAGAAYKGRPIGSIGDASIFSFHPIKNLTTGEGGMITTADDALAGRMRLLRFHGVERDAWKAYGGAQLPLYDVSAPGLKYNLTDIQSAIGIHQLRKLAAFNAERTRLAARYDAAFAALPALRPLGRVPYPHMHAHHLYVVRLDLDRVTVDRQAFMAAVISAGVGLGLHFTAVHELTYYRQLLGDRRDDLPVATDVSRRLFSLPLYPGLSDADQDRVVEVLADTAFAHRT
ncbi:MAG: DegT/DnrJ/EryC1/StrS family aminotransferase [Candidatus Binatia bacterium]